MIHYFTFNNPNYFWLLLLLPIAHWLRKRYVRYGTLKLSSLDVIKRSAPRKSYLRNPLSILRTLGLILIIFALARPQYVMRFSEKNSSGVDIMLAIDISESMMGLDFSDRTIVTRLDIAKQVTKDFIENRSNDRIGMCAFAGEPYLISPVTLNHDWLVSNLERLHCKLICPGTSIGNTIVMCANRLKDSKSKTKIIVLITDGSNTSGDITPALATETAAALGIKIYTIGIGKTGIVNFARTDENGKIYTNSFGEPIVIQAQADLDIKLLQSIADQTHGQFFRAENKDEFQNIYQTIDRLEKSDVKIQQYSEVNELFRYFVALGLCLLLFEFLLSCTKFQRIP